MKKTLYSILITLCFCATSFPSHATIHQIGTAPSNNPVFSPPTLTMTVGDTVMWRYLGTNTTIYNITNTSIPSGAAPWAASISLSTPTFLYVPTVPGLYNYQAAGMPSLMTGRIHVSACSVFPTALAWGGRGIICPGETDSFYIYNPTNGDTYQWYTNTGAIPGATNSYCLATTTGYYQCTVKNPCNDSAMSNQRNLHVFAPATPTISYTKTGLTYNFTCTATGATAWNWNFGDLTTSTLQNPQHTYAATGTYTVTVTTNATGCAATATQLLNVSTTGIGNTVLENNIIVNPNPASRFISINSNDPNLSLSLYDMAGRMISALKPVDKTANSMSFDINNVPAGLYILEVTGASVMHVRISVVR